MWNDPESVRLMAKVATWLTAIFGFLAAVSAIAQLMLDRRGQSLEEGQKRTAPALNVKAVLASATEVKLLVVTRNLVPFKCQWMVCAAPTNQIVGGVPIGWTTFYPKASRRWFVQTEIIDPGKVRGQSLEVRFDYRSIYAEEVGLPGLGGRDVIPVVNPDDESLREVAEEVAALLPA